MIEASIEWDRRHSGADGEDATWGHLRVARGSNVLWAAARGHGAPGIHWTWIDLLEFLAQHWAWLVSEDGWPPVALPADLSPSDFDYARRRTFESAPPVTRNQLDETLFEFRQRHDLSTSLRGKQVPKFWVVRQGSDGWVGGASAYLAPWEEVERFLNELGNEIANRVEHCTDGRSRQAVRDWSLREQADSWIRAEAAVGVDQDFLRGLAQVEDPASWLELPRHGFGSSELAFAARLAAPSLKPAITRRLLACIRETPPGEPSGSLEQFARRASNVPDPSHFAYDQGYELGAWLRSELGILPNRRSDPEAVLSGWDIVHSEVDLDDDSIDAVACWGPNHGPAVYVNVVGKRAQGDAGRRATLAHEIAHLLIDRERALPLSEVQGGIARSRYEQRANAFAAEFLIPRSVAGDEFSVCSDEDHANRTLRRLAKRFGASAEVVAWQVLNSAARLPPAARGILAQQVPASRRSRFFIDT